MQDKSHPVVLSAHEALKILLDLVLSSLDGSIRIPGNVRAENEVESLQLVLPFLENDGVAS